MHRSMYQPFRTGCFDYVEEYAGLTSIILGTTLVLFGLLSIALGIGAICTLASGYYIGYGIWCGILFCLVGLMCICAGYKKNMCLLVGTCACCIMNQCLALCQIAIAIAAARDDAYGNRGDIQMVKLEPKYLDYDIYYARNNPYKYLCSGPNAPFTWRTSWGPVDVLLILSGFIVFFVSLAAAILTCIHSNTGTRVLIGNPFAINESPEMFGNESYITEKRTGEPGLIMA